VFIKRRTLQLLLSLGYVISEVIISSDVWFSGSAAETKKSAEHPELGDHLSAVDPVGNYLLKRPQHLGDDYHQPEMTSHDKRMADPVGSYLLRRRVDPVGSYLLKKSKDQSDGRPWRNSACHYPAMFTFLL